MTPFQDRDNISKDFMFHRKALTLSSGAANAYMAKESGGSDYLEPMTSSSRSSGKLAPTLTASISNVPSAWHLPDSFDVANLCGIHGNHTRHPNTSCQENTWSVTQMALSPLPLPHKSTPIVQGNLASQSPPCVPSKLSSNYSTVTPKARTTHYSHDLSMVPPTANSSSTKSRNYSSRLAPASADSLDIPSVRSCSIPGIQWYISKDNINLLGRWKSDIVDVYINEESEHDQINCNRNPQLNAKLHNTFNPPKHTTSPSVGLFRATFRQYVIWRTVAHDDVRWQRTDKIRWFEKVLAPVPLIGNQAVFFYQRINSSPSIRSALPWPRQF